MIKRVFDVIFSLLGLVLLSPIMIPVMVMVWLQDFHSPFYIAPRVGKNGVLFNMVKLRSMVINADKSGVDSTSSNDSRITPVGHFIRRCKLDELSQLWNVLIGDMSLVGPRPNVKRETDLYTDIEKTILLIKPGITDFSSIVFSDENDILKDSKDPDLDYNRLIRPWKSRLCMVYAKNQSLFLDLMLIVLTIITLFSRSVALSGVAKLLTIYNTEEKLIMVAVRKSPLKPFPPPGAKEIVTERKAV